MKDNALCMLRRLRRFVNGKTNTITASSHEIEYCEHQIKEAVRYRTALENILEFGPSDKGVVSIAKDALYPNVKAIPPRD